MSSLRGNEQPAHCVGVWVFEVQIVGWGKGGALVDDVMGVCSSAPHGQAADGRRPQRCILARPTPVRSRFSVAQSLRGRSAPGGKLVFGVTESWEARGVCCQLVDHT